jgi:hypothetical protein
MDSPGKSSNGLRSLQMYRAIREMYLLQEQRIHPESSDIENTRRVLKRLYKDSPETLILLENWGAQDVRERIS